MTARFGYPFTDRYAPIDGVRLHYLDEGKGPVTWLMHGNTTWSYLYGKIIPLPVNAREQRELDIITSPTNAGAYLPVQGRGVFELRGGCGFWFYSASLGGGSGNLVIPLGSSALDFAVPSIHEPWKTI